MAITSIMSTGSEFYNKVGVGSVYHTEDTYDRWALTSEAVVNAATKANWSTLYATLESGTKFILNDTVSSLVAINAITSDMTPYPSRIVAEDMINVNRDIVLRNISILRDINAKAFVSGGTYSI